MFSTTESSSKDDLEVIQLQSVDNPLSDMKAELIGNVKEELQSITLNMNTDSTRDVHMQDIQSLTLQNKSAELLNSSSGLESQRSVELPTFSHQPQSSHSNNEIPLEAINSTESTLALDHSQYYDGLNNTPIMVYQMPPGSSIVPFESLVSVPVNKSSEDKSHEAVDLLHTSYTSQEVYNNGSHHVTQPLYLVPDVIKFKGQENEKMLISQIYSPEDPTNIFLDPRHTFVRTNKCEMNITDSLNTDLNLGAASNFDSTIPISSEAEINHFPVSSTYSSTDTDSEVALTLASLGNLKNDKIRENHFQEERILDATFKIVNDCGSNKEKVSTANTVSESKNLFENDTEICPTLVLRSRKDRSHNINMESKKEMEGNSIIVCGRRESGKEKSLGEKKLSQKRNTQSQKNSNISLETKSSCQPRKENLLGQLLKASKHCEPASLIPEGVVDDVIPAVGYRIMDMSNLGEMIRMMHRCSNTVSKGIIFIQEQASLREGAVSQLSIICTGCQEGAICSTSNKSHGDVFDINARVEQLTKEFNIKEAQVQRMLEILGIFYRPSDQTLGSKKLNPPKTEEDRSKMRKRKKTQKTKEKNVECKICHKKFLGVNYLKSHMFMHDNLLHTCPYCQAYFKRVFNLQEHIKKHENIKYECDICHKSYTDRSTLCAHKKSFHQLAYKQECEICSKKFFHKAHYVEHMRVHTGEKPYACDICGKRYPYVNSVKKHKQSHCTVAKYKCRLCGKWFRWLLGIRQHLCQQHKLKKCDVDAQVITDVIAETLPITSPPKKHSGVFKAQGDQNKKIVDRQNSDKFSNYSKSSNASLVLEDSPSTLNLENSTRPTQQSFHMNSNEQSVCANLSDWKKRL